MNSHHFKAKFNSIKYNYFYSLIITIRETDEATYNFYQLIEGFILIRKMLDRNQETRIKAQDILNHRWITGEKTKKPTKVYKASSVL